MTPDKLVRTEIDRLLTELPHSGDIICIKAHRHGSSNDKYYQSLDEVPDNLKLDGDIVITVWTESYILYTEHHDTWPDRMGKAHRNPP